MPFHTNQFLNYSPSYPYVAQPHMRPSIPTYLPTYPLTGNDHSSFLVAHQNILYFYPHYAHPLSSSTGLASTHSSSPSFTTCAPSSAACLAEQSVATTTTSTAQSTTTSNADDDDELALSRRSK